MTMTPWQAVLAGSALGAAAGWLSRLALKRVIRASDPVFYSVFIGGIFARLGLVAAVIWQLRHENYKIIILFAAPLIVAQMCFEAFPIKHGPESNT
ncbi:MAG: hypothetical protein NDI60_05380 [Elusimicrobiales bacterium]|nr:hypothetical protein [Elusimicrobiales bacterium]